MDTCLAVTRGTHHAAVAMTVNALGLDESPTLRDTSFAYVAVLATIQHTDADSRGVSSPFASCRTTVQSILQDTDVVLIQHVIQAHDLNICRSRVAGTRTPTRGVDFDHVLVGARLANQLTVDASARSSRSGGGLVDVILGRRARRGRGGRV